MGENTKSALAFVGGAALARRFRRAPATLALCAFLLGWFVFIQIPVYAVVPPLQFDALFYLPSPWPSPGSLLAGISHASAGHLVGNVLVLAFFGWKAERHEPRHRYLLFFAVAAYLALFVESVVSARLLRVRVITIGSSGGVLAVATYATVRSWPAHRVVLEWRPETVTEGVRTVARTPSVLLLVVGTVAIPLTLLADFLDTATTVGRYAHLTGTLVGGLYGLYALWRNSRTANTGESAAHV